MGRNSYRLDTKAKQSIPFARKVLAKNEFPAYPSAPLDHEQTFQSGASFGADRFVIETVLGEGGMGVVCRAYDQMLHKTVALKFLSPLIQANDVALESMRNETRKSLDLTHPNIVRIHDFHHFTNDLPFICMEFIDGITMAYLKSEQPEKLFPWEAIEALMPQICSALGYAHGVGIIHRDLKPANMMLDQNRCLKLADFGLSVAAGDVDENDAMGTSGTPCYMSPQQLVGVPSVPTDDIYALGATLYELLTSQPPFYQGDILAQVRDDDPPPMSTQLKNFGLENVIPRHVEKLVMDCLQKDPDLRPQSMAEIAQRLGIAAADDLPTVIGHNTNRANNPGSKANSSDNFKGKSAVIPAVVFCGITILAAILVGKPDRDTEQVAPSRQPSSTSGANTVADRAPNLQALTAVQVLNGAVEVRLMKYRDKSGPGSATFYRQYPISGTHPRWRSTGKRIQAKLTPAREGELRTLSQLVFATPVNHDFEFGFAWKNQKPGALPLQLFHHCEAPAAKSLLLADISIDGIRTNPNRPEAISCEGIVGTYRVRTQRPMRVRDFAAIDWTSSGEPALAAMILKLTTSPLVREGGSWMIIQRRGDRIRHIINGTRVAEGDLTEMLAAANADNQKQLLERHAAQPGKFAIELTADSLTGEINAEFGEFTYNTP